MNTTEFYSTVPTVTKNGTTDDCFPLAYQMETVEMRLGGVWMGLAVLLGLLVGSAVTLAAVQFYFKKKWVQRNEDQIRLTSGKSKKFNKCCSLLCCCCVKRTNRKVTDAGIAETKRLKTAAKAEVNTQFGYVKLDSNDPELGKATELVDRKLSTISITERGMVDILMQPTVEAAELEMIKQENKVVKQLEETVKDHREEVAHKLARIHLNQIDTEDKEMLERITKEFREQMSQAKIAAENDFKAALHDLSKKSLSEEEFKQERDRLIATHQRKLHSLITDGLAEFQNYLNSTTLTPEQIAAFMQKFKESLFELEQLVGDNINLRSQLMADTEAHRLYFLDQSESNKLELEKEVKDNCEALAKTANKVFEDGKLSETAKAELLKAFKASMEELRNRHLQAVHSEMVELAGKLRQQHQTKLDNLRARHKQQMEKLSSQGDNITDPNQYLDAVQDLLEKQAQETADMTYDMDKEESEKLNQINLKMEKTWKTSVQTETDKIFEMLRQMTHLPANEIKNIVRQHELELMELEKLRDIERKMQLGNFRDKLEQRKKKAKEDAVMREVEQAKLENAQEILMQRVLDSQVGLDDETRKHILSAHEHNQQVLNSILSLANLKQRKKLEQTLAERKAHLAQLQSEKSAAKNQKKSPAAQQTLDDNYKRELEKFDEEKSSLVQELRHRMALETEAALKEQDSRLADVIGRLQVGQARRLAVIQKQEKMVKKMEFLKQVEEELKKRAVEDKLKPDIHQLDSLLKEHKEHVAKLSSKLDETRDRQMKSLQEKLEAKRKEKKKELESRLGENQNEIMNLSHKQRISFASGLMAKNKVQNNHDVAMERMENDIAVELQMKRDHQNRQLQMELERSLLDQKKQFLSRLAVICQLSPDQINHMTDRAKRRIGEDPDRDRDSTEGSLESVGQQRVAVHYSKGEGIITRANVLKPIDRGDNKRAEQIELRSNSTGSASKTNTDGSDVI